MNKIRTLWEDRSKKYKYDFRGVLPKSFPFWLNNILHKWTFRQVQKVMKDGDRVLDLGCGYGRVAGEVLKNFPKTKVAGVDISKNYVDLFNKRLSPRGIAYQGDIKKLEFKSNSFDVVYIMATLMYLVERSDQKRAVGEIIRVLKPGGTFIFIERNPVGHSLMTLGGIITILRGKKHKEIESVSFKKRELSNLITESGGKIISVISFPFGSFYYPSLYISYTGIKR